MTEVVQFGTSRFLQAHADLILSQARDQGQDVGLVTVVETTGSPASRARIEAFSRLDRFPVKIRGLKDGALVDETVEVGGITAGLSARGDFERLVATFVQADYVVSNTGDRGYDVPAQPSLDQTGWSSFPELLTVLLLARYRSSSAPLILLPCELKARNGDSLRAVVLNLADHIAAEPAFKGWISNHCIFVNSLVDRIVSEPIEPIGAVTEPYALWAVEARDRLMLPCIHPALVVVDDLTAIENKKLFILNLAHTLLAERWLRTGAPTGLTVRDAMGDSETRHWIFRIVEEEIVPAFDERDQAEDYWRQCVERFDNPFLNHRLADIAQNHEAKIVRRAGGLVRFAAERRRTVPRLEALFPGLLGADHAA
jgi:tagaturonate reductase